MFASCKGARAGTNHTHVTWNYSNYVMPTRLQR